MRILIKIQKKQKTTNIAKDRKSSSKGIEQEKKGE